MLFSFFIRKQSRSFPVDSDVEDFNFTFFKELGKKQAFYVFFYFSPFSDLLCNMHKAVHKKKKNTLDVEFIYKIIFSNVILLQLQSYENRILASNPCKLHFLFPVSWEAALSYKNKTTPPNDYYWHTWIEMYVWQAELYNCRWFVRPKYFFDC